MPLPAGTERGGEAGENNKRRAKNAIKSGGAPERGAGVRSAVRVCVCLCFFTPCGRSGCVRAVPGRGGRRVPSLPRAVLRSSLGDAEESLLLRDAPRGARIPARCSPSLRGAPEPRGTSSPEEKKKCNNNDKNPSSRREKASTRGTDRIGAPPTGPGALSPPSGCRSEWVLFQQHRRARNLRAHNLRAPAAAILTVPSARVTEKPRAGAGGDRADGRPHANGKAEPSARQ